MEGSNPTLVSTSHSIRNKGAHLLSSVAPLSRLSILDIQSIAMDSALLYSPRECPSTEHLEHKIRDRHFRSHSIPCLGVRPFLGSRRTQVSTTLSGRARSNLDHGFPGSRSTFAVSLSQLS